MFFSLNKKFLFTIFAFFLLSASIFLIIFDGTIGKKIRSEHINLTSRNQYPKSPILIDFLRLPLKRGKPKRFAIYIFLW